MCIAISHWCARLKTVHSSEVHRDMIVYNADGYAIIHINHAPLSPSASILWISSEIPLHVSRIGAMFVSADFWATVSRIRNKLSSRALSLVSCVSRALEASLCEDDRFWSHALLFDSTSRWNSLQVDCRTCFLCSTEVLERDWVRLAVRHLHQVLLLAHCTALHSVQVRVHLHDTYNYHHSWLIICYLNRLGWVRAYSPCVSID